MKTKGECKKMNKCANKETKDPVRVRAAKRAWVTIRANRAEDHGQTPLDNFGVFGPKNSKKSMPIVMGRKKDPRYVRAAKKAWVTIRKNKAHKVASARMKKVWAKRKKVAGTRKSK